MRVIARRTMAESNL